MHTFDPETERLIQANRANWDARVPIHLASAFYGLDGTRDSAGWFAGYEWADLGDLGGADLLHLQCHLGTESIALARRGARVVGLDISGESVRSARRVAAGAGVSIEFVESDVYNAPAALGGRKFDLIYTGKGAVCYLPELAPWAEVVAALLKPGGSLYLVEFHPLLYALGILPLADGNEELLVRNDYLGNGTLEERDSTRTYTDGPPLAEATASYEWRHDLGGVVTALSGAGLRIDRLRESDTIPWQRWSTMVPAADEGWYRLPDDAPRIPLLYALLASKPSV